MKYLLLLSLKWMYFLLYTYAVYYEVLPHNDENLCWWGKLGQEYCNLILKNKALLFKKIKNGGRSRIKLY